MQYHYSFVVGVCTVQDEYDGSGRSEQERKAPVGRAVDKSRKRSSKSKLSK